MHQPAPLSLRFPAADGYELEGDLYRPEGPARGAVLVAGAMGVPRRYYAPFAAFLAEAGFAVLAFDYRGIGGSAPARLRHFPARLQDWADLDLPAAAAALRRESQGPLLFLGHSVGGQLFGLTDGLGAQAALFVASQSGHWRNWPSVSGRLVIGALWYLLIPLFTRLCGFLPMRFFRQGENLPAGVARQWAAWGRDPLYVLGHARRTKGIDFFGWEGPIRFCAVSDDRYAPPSTVEELHSFYPRARRELALLRPADFGVRAIGHFGPFRPRFRESLWQELRGWLLAHAAVEIDAAAR